MIFKRRPDGKIECVDWVELEFDDVTVGNLVVGDNGYYYFIPSKIRALTCIMLKHLYKKLHKLNTEIE